MAVSLEEMEELLGLLVAALVEDRVAPDDVPWHKFGEDLQRSIFEAVAHEKRRRAHRRGQRRAMRLLRSLLPEEQREAVRRSGCFRVVGSLGGVYRLHPHHGAVERVERHGRHWFATVNYCLHDDGREMPAADLTLAHMLWLLSDEARFLAEANARPMMSELWNGDYMRRLREARIRRAQALPTPDDWAEDEPVLAA